MYVDLTALGIESEAGTGRRTTGASHNGPKTSVNDSTKRQSFSAFWEGCRRRASDAKFKLRRIWLLDKRESGRKDFLPVEPQGGLSFLFRLSEPRFA